MHKNTFNAKSLIGNWHENRYTEDYNKQHNATSNTFLQNPSYNKYVPIGRDYGNQAGYKKEAFGDATENWMNFQPGFKQDETFKTTAAMSYCGMQERRSPFELRQTGLTKDQAALEEYRQKYTAGNHNFKRTYLGASNWKKSDQDDQA